jgi:hypothetical protein
MAITIGSVTIHPTTAVVSGSGFILAAFNILKVEIDAHITSVTNNAASKLSLANSKLSTANAELAAANALPVSDPGKAVKIQMAQLNVTSAQSEVDTWTSQGSVTAKRLELYPPAKTQAENIVAMFEYFMTNATVTSTVGTSLSGLQRMPASTAENTDTKAPSVNKTIPGAIT